MKNTMPTSLSSEHKSLPSMPTSHDSLAPLIYTYPSGQHTLQPSTSSTPSSMPSKLPYISTKPSLQPSYQPSISIWHSRQQHNWWYCGEQGGGGLEGRCRHSEGDIMLSCYLRCKCCSLFLPNEQSWQKWDIGNAANKLRLSTILLSHPLEIKKYHIRRHHVIGRQSIGIGARDPSLSLHKKLEANLWCLCILDAPTGDQVMQKMDNIYV